MAHQHIKMSAAARDMTMTMMEYSDDNSTNHHDDGADNKVYAVVSTGSGTISGRRHKPSLLYHQQNRFGHIKRQRIFIFE